MPQNSMLNGRRSMQGVQSPDSRIAILPGVSDGPTGNPSNKKDSTIGVVPTGKRNSVFLPSIPELL